MEFNQIYSKERGQSPLPDTWNPKFEDLEALFNHNREETLTHLPDLLHIQISTPEGSASVNPGTEEPPFYVPRSLTERLDYFQQ